MKVAVIGAGISGIQAALLLQAQGADVIVFEARNRVGGRIETISDHGAIYEADVNGLKLTNRCYKL